MVDTPKNGAAVPLAGVVVVPQKLVHLDIQAQVAKALEGIDKGDTMAVVNVHTGAGINLALAHKFNEEWQVAAWVGKSGWSQPVEYGATVSYSR